MARITNPTKTLLIVAATNLVILALLLKMSWSTQPPITSLFNGGLFSLLVLYGLTISLVARIVAAGVRTRRTDWLGLGVGLAILLFVPATLVLIVLPELVLVSTPFLPL